MSPWYMHSNLPYESSDKSVVGRYTSSMSPVKEVGYLLSTHIIPNTYLCLFGGAYIPP